MTSHETQVSSLRVLFAETGWKGNAEPLTEEGIIEAAMRLNPEKPDVSLVRAVIRVEAAGKPFLTSGRPTLRFETHVFSRETNRKFDETHPHLSTRDFDVNHSWTGERAYDQFNEAFNLDRVAAVRSCSWGAPQIMGFNALSLGFSTYAEFVNTMMESADAQLSLMIEFIVVNNIKRSLVGHRWLAFASVYNTGRRLTPENRASQQAGAAGVYARRLTQAYYKEKHSARHISPEEAKRRYENRPAEELGADVVTVPDHADFNEPPAAPGLIGRILDFIKRVF